MSELKPCPFCGGSAMLLERIDTGVSAKTFYDVGCGTYDCYLEFGAEWWKTREDAVRKWNARTDARADALAERLAEAEALLTKVRSLKGMGTIAIKKQIKEYFEGAA